VPSPCGRALETVVLAEPADPPALPQHRPCADLESCTERSSMSIAVKINRKRAECGRRHRTTAAPTAGVAVYSSSPR
jgi:hypothetical protein